MSELLRVLLLEDDAADADLELALLAKAGFECRARRVDDRAGFEAALAAGTWDVIFADYNLPTFTGTEALALTRARDPFVPFILVSGALGEDRAIESLRAGATDYVLKQHLARLVPALRRALSGHRARLQHLATQQALEASERRYRAIVDDQSELICRMTAEGALTFVNQAFCRYFGRPAGELVGSSFLELLPQETDAAMRDAWRRLDPDDPMRQGEYPAVDGEGRRRWQSWSMRGLFGDGRELTEIQAVGRDVTERFETVAALRASEARFERVLRGSIDGYWDWNLAEDRIYYSPRFLEQLGFDDTEPFVSKFSFRELLHSEDARRVLGALRRTTDDGQPFREEFRLRRADGSHPWFFGRGERVQAGAGGASHFVGSIVEISERKRIEASLHDALERLRHLSHRVIGALEDERAYLARELHDQIGQVLTAVKINVQGIARQVTEPAPRARLDDSVATVDAAIDQIRRLSLNLRPPQLDELGLEAALRAHLERQAASGGLAAHFNAAPLPKEIDPDVQIACFRIAQESLTNVLRHAQAGGVWVELGAGEGTLMLAVRDDGVGFDIAASGRRAVTGESLGLVSMEERAALLGGTLSVASAPGKGTEVRASFPLQGRPRTVPDAAPDVA